MLAPFHPAAPKRRSHSIIQTSVTSARARRAIASMGHHASYIWHVMRAPATTMQHVWIGPGTSRLHYGHHSHPAIWLHLPRRRPSLAVGLEQGLPLLMMRPPSLSMPPAAQRRSMTSIPNDDDSLTTMQPRVPSRFGVQASRHSAPPLQLQESLGLVSKEPGASARSIGSAGSPSSMSPLGGSARQESASLPGTQHLKERARAVLQQQPAQVLQSTASSTEHAAAAGGSSSRAIAQPRGAQAQGATFTHGTNAAAELGNGSGGWMPRGQSGRSFVGRGSPAASGRGHDADIGQGSTISSAMLSSNAMSVSASP